MTDEAWINWDFNEVGFLTKSDRLYFTSEESGYSQLYLRKVDTDEKTRLGSASPLRISEPP